MLTNDIFNLSQSEQLSVNIKVGLVFWREQRSKNAIHSMLCQATCEAGVPHGLLNDELGHKVESGTVIDSPTWPITGLSTTSCALFFFGMHIRYFLRLAIICTGAFYIVK